MYFRNYDPEKDQKSAHRIFREVGWVENEEHEKALDIFLSGGRTLVADINNEAECLAASMPGEIKYLEQDISLSAITSVVTSRIARKQGFARRLTSQLIAENAADGAAISGLGIFEQGFYNLLGYGGGSYEHWTSFDPAQLKISVRPRVPRRLTTDDWEMVHAALLARQRGHGAANILSPQYTRGELNWMPEGFGLGYCDGPDGELTHFFWSTAKGEHGPYSVHAMAYQSWEQFLELMGLVRNLGDQIHQVWMREPSSIMLQDLLDQPFRFRRLTEKSKFEQTNRATAYWQLRICDLPGCLTKTHLLGDTLRFNLELSDPIEKYLDEDAAWHGVAGEYIVSLGPESSAVPGMDIGLPTLRASVGAFTRMWLGVRPASGLAVSDDLVASPDLLTALDQALRLPPPRLDWDF